jgi:hypothetical protein
VLSTWAQIAGIVSSVLAVLGTAIATGRHLRNRARGSWWQPLQPLLAHLRDAAIAHPHRFGDGYLPALAEVYVERRVVLRNAPPGPAAGRAMAAGALLVQARDVVLIGEPGSGKTAYVRHATAGSAHAWLAGRGRRRGSPAGPVVVNLPATALVGHSIPSALAAAYQTVAPGVDFTRQPAPGRQWLVCVDGVDAAPDPDQRSIVLSRLAARHPTADPADPAGPAGRPWRALVTTRQLAEDELPRSAAGTPSTTWNHSTTTTSTGSHCAGSGRSPTGSRRPKPPRRRFATG